MEGPQREQHIFIQSKQVPLLDAPSNKRAKIHNSAMYKHETYDHLGYSVVALEDIQPLIL